MVAGEVKILHKADFWNDRITSFRIGSGVRIKLCAHSSCENVDGRPGYVEYVGPV